MDCILIFSLVILAHYGVICSPQESRRFLFDQTAGLTTPDPTYLTVELNYMRNQLHELSDKNIHLTVQNSVLSSQLQQQNQIINSLTANATNLENSYSAEISALKDKIHDLETKLNESNNSFTQLMSNISNCSSLKKQLENALNESHSKVDILEKKLNMSMSTCTSAASLEQCKQNESALLLQLQTATSKQQDCSHQNTVLLGEVSHIQTKLNESNSRLQTLESNWTTCLKHTSQLKQSFNVSLARIYRLERNLSDVITERNNLSNALTQCHQMPNSEYLYTNMSLYIIEFLQQTCNL
jgi:chromosome segregation ATPase